MKAILLSIRPEHALNILNGKKTLELRKRVPKDFVGWVYVYVTKAIKDYKQSYYYQPKGKENIFRLHGTIPFRFWLGSIYKLVKHDYVEAYHKPDRYEPDVGFNWILDNACLTDDELWNYGKGKTLYAWHIKKLEIFDKPMQLREFRKKDLSNVLAAPTDWPIIIDNNIVKRPPRSYQYVWVKE